MIFSLDTGRCVPQTAEHTRDPEGAKWSVDRIEIVARKN